MHTASSLKSKTTTTGQVEWCRQCNIINNKHTPTQYRAESRSHMEMVFHCCAVKYAKRISYCFMNEHGACRTCCSVHQRWPVQNPQHFPYTHIVYPIHVYLIYALQIRHYVVRPIIAVAMCSNPIWSLAFIAATKTITDCVLMSISFAIDSCLRRRVWSIHLRDIIDVDIELLLAAESAIAII